MIREHHISVVRTARYFTAGDPRQAPREVWFACHGYGQLASRFLRALASLDDGHRYIVAPEALSRFYLHPAVGGSHAQAGVGASWMTREDRLAEIDDYVGYLDAVAARVFEEVDRSGVSVVVLGFSQGAATASRWLIRGSVRADRFIVWGGLLAGDLDLAHAAARLRGVDVVLVAGEDDAMLPASDVAAHAEQLARHGIAHRIVRYAGGHAIDPEVLRGVARGA